jgi:DNA-binding transcriptional ArsR family regulator
MELAQTFKALGDPVRLEMIQRLSTGSSQSIASLSVKFGLSRQGARKHLQILANAGLISLRTIGRNTEVTLEADSLHAAKSYIAELEAQWDKRLYALREFMETTNKTS